MSKGPFQRLQSLALLVAVGATLAAAPVAAAPGVTGKVFSIENPLPSVQVYAYQLAELTFERVLTDQTGGFTFDSLPAGLYKIIAFKSGFVPTVALLTRPDELAAQFLEMQLVEEQGQPGTATDFWSVRQKIPPDVLRHIEQQEAVAYHRELPESPNAVSLASLKAEMQAFAGIGTVPSGAEAQVTGGAVEVESDLRSLKIGLEGNFVEVGSNNDFEQSAATEGSSRQLAIDVDNLGRNEVRVTTQDHKLAADLKLRGPVDVESHQVSWSREGKSSRADVRALYMEESNFYRQSGLGRLGVPSASQSWGIEGSYATNVGDHSHVEAGFRFRESAIDPAIADSVWLLPQERIDVYGRAGHRVKPSVLVEYGLYSTLRDGTVSLMPQGGLVVQVSDRWRASTGLSLKAHEAEPVDSVFRRGQQGFTTAQFQEYTNCRGASDYCYEVGLSREGKESSNSFRIGALHRKFDETLRLHFDDNFFNFHENLFLVEGDTIPELQVELTRRLGPQVLTRLESHVGTGGGGVLFLTKRARPFENHVKYHVTSLDTQFQATDTGVFVAFHQLEQRLDPIRRPRRGRYMELERLQVMLTQDLGLFDALATDFAVKLNMELSRGALPTAEEVDPDELRRRITGGIAVKF